MNVISRCLQLLKHLRIDRHSVADEDLELRDMLNRGFTADAALGAAKGLGLRPDQEQRLWHAIDRAFPVDKKTSMPPSLTLAGTQWPLMLSGLAAACICAILYGRQTHTDTFKQDIGIKGSAEVTPTLKTLRFAILKPDGQTVPGENLMIMERGHSLIFFAETEGIAPGQEFPVTLSYRREGEDKLIKVIDTSLTESRQVLSGNKGYIAFTPELAGTYRLILTPETKDKNENTEDKNAAEISIQVVHPD